MSAIFGVVNLNGQPVALQTLKEMQQAISNWGPDGQYLWNEDNAGMGQLQLFNTPESLHEKFPLIDNDRGLIFMSACRIDNRDELFHLLDTPNELKHTITDAELIFNAYRKWGNESVHKLLGDWSFAVWHKYEKKLFLARDHHGNTSMYYYSENNEFIFGTSLKSILSVKKNIKLNKKVAENYLKSNSNIANQTFFKSILRLGPAHYLTVQKNNLKLKHYWEPIDLKIRYNKQEDYYNHFKEIFDNAVICRLRTNKEVGSTLSSGLDSSIVTSIAAHHLLKYNKLLYAYTSVPKYKVQQPENSKIYYNEGYLAEELSGRYPNIIHKLLDCHDSSILDSIKTLIDIYGYPGKGISNAYWIQSILQTAKADNCSILLTGQGGNLTLSWPNNFIKIDGLAIANIKYLLKRTRSILKLILSIDKNVTYPKYVPNPDFHKGRIQVFKPGKSTIGSSWHELGNYFGLEVRDPTLDRRVIDYCFSIPPEIFLNKTERRLLAKKTYENILPLALLNNDKRAIQIGDIKLRIFDEKGLWLKELQKKHFDGNYIKIAPLLNFLNGDVIIYDSNLESKDTVSLLKSICFNNFINFMNK